MAQRGKPSTAHEYDKNQQCIHCGMHKANVESMSHVCTPEREKITDEKTEYDQLEAEAAKLGVDKSGK